MTTAVAEEQECELHIVEAFVPFMNSTHRYNVSWGGRGAGKTENIIRIVLLECMEFPHLVLCCREIQNSIKDSVKKVIEDIIEEMGPSVQKFFKITDKHIIGKNGCKFIFEGLYRNATKIKAYKGITICLIDEGQAVSKKSFKDLIPTIRMKGSRFFIMFNSEKATDPVYRMFVDDEYPTPYDAFILKINYDQNPFFPSSVLFKEMEHDREHDYEKYLHVWEGELEVHSEAVIFSGKYVVKEYELGDECDFLFGADWGFSQDPTAIVRCCVNEENREIYIDYEAGGVGIEFENIPPLFDKVPGTRKHLIRADSARPETISYMRNKHQFNIIGVEKGKGSVEDGIEFLKSYTLVVHIRCVKLIQELKNYSFKVNRHTEDITSIIIDAWNHFIDALRYAIQPLIKQRKRALRIGFSS